MTERSDKAASIAFYVVVVCVLGAILFGILVGPGDTRDVLAGFVGGIIAVLAVGVAQWISRGSKDKPSKGDETQPH